MIDFSYRRAGVSVRALLLSQVAMAALLSAGGKAAAQNAPTNIQALPNSASAIEAITPGVNAVYSVGVDQISPTQPNVGMSEVAKKTADWNIVPANQLQSTLEQSIESVIIGPGGSLYLTNGHHTFTSLQDSIYGSANPTVYVNVVANYSSDTPAQFVVDMEKAGAVYPVNDGVPETIIGGSASAALSPIPNSLQGLTNDSYRGLEFSVLKNKGSAGVGFDKTGDDFSDFIWADAYRSANGGLGLPYLSPGDVNAAAAFSQNASNPVTIVGVTGTGTSGSSTNTTIGQLPGYILQSNVTVAGTVGNATLATGALASTGQFNGINGLYLNGGAVVLEPAQPGFVMQLGSNGTTGNTSDGTSVTLSNTGNSYTGGTYIAAGNLVTAFGGSSDALGAAAPTGGTIDLSNGNLNVQSSVQSENGIVFDSLSEGAGTLTFGTNTSGGSAFTETRNIAVGGEVATINTNGNTITLTGQIATANLGESGYAGLTLDDLTGNGTLKIDPTASQGNSGFYGNYVVTSGTLELMNNAALGSNGSGGTASGIDLDGGTFKAGTGLTGTGTSVFLTGGSTFDVNGFASSFGSLTDQQRVLTIANSGSASGTSSGSVSFGTSEFSATATLLFSGSNSSSVSLGSITRDPGATLFLTPSSSAAGTLGSVNKVFASGAAATNTDGIVAPWIIIDSGGSASTSPYDFASYSTSNGFVVASYTSTYGSANVVKQSGSKTLTGSNAAYALNVQNGGKITISGSGGTLAIGDGTDPAGLIMNGSASISSGTLSFGGSEAVISVKSSNTISSVITGTNGLTLAGSGSLTLSGSNTYSGGTTIDSGTLSLTATNGISGDITLEDNKSKPSAAVLAMSANETFAALNSTGNNSSVTLSGGAVLTIGDASNQSSTFSGSISDTGTPAGGFALVKEGTGLLDLSGMSKKSITLAGSTGVDVAAGDLRIASNIFNSTSTGITVGSGAELQFAQGGGGTFANAITGSGDVRLVGGTVQLTGVNSYTGGTYVEWGGTLDTSTGSTNGNIYSSGMVVFDQTTSQVFNGTISNGTAGPLGMIGTTNPGGSFVKDDSTGANSGNVIFDTVQGYSGSTSVEAGTLTLGTGNAIASSSSVDLGRVGGGATATLSLDASNSVNALNSEQGDTSTVALNGNTLTVNEAAHQQSTYRGSVTDTGSSGGGVVLTGAGRLNLVGGASGSPTAIAGSLTVSAGSTLAVSGSVNFTGTVTNSSAFISDPANLDFTTFTVNPGGYVDAAAGDLYDITQDFDNHSTQGSLWNTSGATLEFSGGTNHALLLTGANIGQFVPSEDAAFAWGDLDLASSGDSITLGDGLSTPDSDLALYVGAISGLDFAGGQIFPDNLITNIFGDGYDIYYDPSLAANAYLDSQTYDLEDGGKLIASVPEPGPWSVMLSGLLGLGWLRRRRKSPPRR